MLKVTIERAGVGDAPIIAMMVSELLHEIMDAIGVNAFNTALLNGG